MSMARVSLFGMMQYDNTLFDEFVVPSAPWNSYFIENNIDIAPPDVNALIAHILRRTANLEIFYPAMMTLKQAIRFWSITNAYKFKRLWESLHYEYNPIWNKDAHYTEREDFTRNLKDTYAEETTGNLDEDIADTAGTNATKQMNATDNFTHENKVSAFNQNGYQDREHDTTQDQKSQTDTLTQSDTYNRDRGQSETGTKDSVNDATGTTSTERTRREWGNIGVTTSQQMIQADRDLALFNWYDAVADSFIAEFCIQVF